MNDINYKSEIDFIIRIGGEGGTVLSAVVSYLLRRQPGPTTTFSLTSPIRLK